MQSKLFPSVAKCSTNSDLGRAQKSLTTAGLTCLGL